MRNAIKKFTLMVLLLIPAMGFSQYLSYSIRVNWINSYEGGVFGNCWENGNEEYSRYVHFADNSNTGLSMIVNRIDYTVTGTVFTCDQCTNNGNCSRSSFSTHIGSRTNTNAVQSRVRLYAWEDDSGGRCDYNSGDDCRRLQYDYRNFADYPANQWNTFQFGSTNDHLMNYSMLWSCNPPFTAGEYGNNQWYVHVYDGRDYNLNNLPYMGRYTETALSFNSANRWGTGGTPASASGYVGCDPGVDNHTVSYKRQGFPCGVYQLSIPTHDDEVQLWVDGIKVADFTGCCVNRGVVWTGYLGADSRVEYRWGEGGGGSQGVLNFNKIGNAPGNPATFTTDLWTAYVYDGTNINLSGVTYVGYYAHGSDLNFDSRDRWCNTCSPADNNAYQGCDPGYDSHTVVYKRKGFPCGRYRLSIPSHDDDVRVYLNGSQIFQHLGGCCDSHNNFTTVNLDENSTIEYRWMEGVGGSHGALSFTRIANPPTVSCPSNITVGTGSTNCVGTASWNQPTYNDACEGSPIVGFTYVGGYGQNHYYRYNGSVTWTDANSIAIANGGDLVGISNGSENTFVRNNITGSTWIGFNDAASEGNFVWSSGEPNSGYTNWNPGEPNNAGNVEDYGEMQTTGRWNDLPNSTLRPFMMEIGAVQTCGIASGGTFPLGTTTICYEGRNQNNETANCSFSVTVVDNQNPSISCPSNIVVNASSGSCDANVNYNVNYSDNCSGVTLSQTAGIGSGGSFPVGSTTNSFTATDASGNTRTCSFTVTVNDNQAPVISCPSNIVASAAPGACNANIIVPAPNVTDNCASGWSLAFDGNSEYVNAGANASLKMSSTMTLEAWVYPTGNQNGVIFNREGEYEIARFPDGNLYWAFANSNPGWAWVGTNTSMPLNTWTHIAVTYSSGVIRTYKNGVLSHVYNGSGNIGDVDGSRNQFWIGGRQCCAQFFQGRIDEVRAWNVTRSASQISNTYKTTLNGNESGLRGYWPMEEGTGSGTTVDASTQSNNGTLVNMELNTDWIAPGAPVFNGTLTNSFNGTADASGTYPVGTTTVTWTATDPSGNSTSCTMTVTVNDNQNPTIGCPSSITVNNDVGVCGANVSYALSTNDNCGIASTTVTPASGSSFPVGSTNVSATTTDLSGNTASCSFTVTVNDNQAPSLTCQNITANLGAGQTVTIAPNQVLSSSSDNCAITSTSVSPNTFTCSNLGQTVAVTVTASDAAGNSSNCTANVTIADPNSVCNQPPNAVCQNITVSANGNCQGTAVAADFDGGSTDPNGDPLTFSVSPAGPYALGNTTVTLTVSDPAGLQDQCTATITVVDNTAPVAVCQDLTVQLNASGNASITAGGVNNGSSDNCQLSAIAVTPSTFGCNNLGNNTVTLTATDASGNTGTCTANITVQDNIAPAAVCQDLTVQLNASGNASITASGVNNGSSDNCQLSAIAVTPSTFGCNNLGNNTVTLTATDASGNTGTCTANITVQDNIAPAAVCQDLTVQLNASGNASITASGVNNGSSDNCQLSAIAVTPSTFGCNNLGSNTVTLTATDGSGNTGTCTATITVQDNIAPTISCPANVVLCADAFCQTTLPDFTGMGTSVLANSSQDFNGAQGFRNWEYARASYSNGSLFNWARLPNFTGFVHNNSGTTLNFPQLDANGGHPDLDNLLHAVRRWTSNYNGAATLHLEFYDRDQNCGDGAHVRVFQNNSEIWQYFNVPGNLQAFDIPVNLSCGDVLDFSIDPKFNAGCDDTHFTIEVRAANSASAADNCGVTSVTQSPAPLSGTQPGTTAVTLTASDAAGNQTSCTFNVDVQDQTAPNAVCQDVTVQLNAAGNGSTSASAVDNGSSDNCSVASLALSKTSFGCGDVGNNQVTLTVTDGAGNTNTCTANVSVQDNVAPVANCQDVTVQLDASGNGSTSASAVNNGSSDACGIASTSLSQTSFACADVGGNTVTLTVTDNNGNVSTCTANVEVEDNIAPVALCKDITVQLNGSGSGSLTPADIDNGSNDACGIGNLAISITTFKCGNVGGNIVSLIVTDNNGNTASCTANVSVQDTVPPAAVCQDVTVQLDAAGNGSTTPNAVDNGSGDACGISSLTLDNSNFTCADVGNNTVTLTATDLNGNSSSCTANVSVQDNVAPVAVCQDVTVQLDASGNGSTTASAVDNGSSDACGIQSLALSATSFTCANVGPNGVTLTVTDNNGNVSTCSANVEVEDNVAPVAVCQDVTVQLDASGNGSTTASAVDNGSSDACGIQSLALSTTAFTCADVGGNAVTLTVTDNNGNVTTCSANVEVEDNVAPVAVCQDVTVQLDASGNGSTTANAVDNGSSDACGIQSLALSTTAFTCADVGGNPVTLTVTDNNGNVTTCSANVEVEDNVAPVALCQDVTVQLDASGNGSTTANAVDNGSSDACGIQSLVLSATSFTCANVGPNGVTLTVTDNNGNVSTCSANVEVEDNVAPVAVCQDVTVQLDASGNGSTTASAVDNGSSDACGIQSLALSTTAFTCADVGGNAVTLTVTDNNGNVSTCSANVEVEDNVAPIALCQDVTVQLDASGNGSTTANAVDNGSSDACGIQSLALSTTSFTCADVGGNPVILTVTDNNGNVTTCSANVEVEDNVAPVAICQDITINLDSTGTQTVTTAQIDNGSNDACGIQSLSVNPNTFDCSQDGPNTVTLTVTDVNNNVSTCTAIVTVTNDPLLITGLTSPTYNCGFNVTCNGATDGSASVTVQGGCLPYTYAWSDGQTTSTASGLGAGTYTVTVTDANGTTTSQAITLTEPALLTSNINKVKYQCNYNISCNGASDGRAVAFATGGCAPYSFSWSGPGGFSSSGQAIIGVPAGTYNVNIVDANGCATSNSVTLTEPALLVSTVSSPTFNCGYNITCNGANDGSVDLGVTGGCAPYAYSWTGPGGFSSNTEDISSLVAGTYNVSITDRNGCSTNNTITLTEPAELVVDSIIKSVYACGYSISCNGASDGTVNALVSGGCQPYNYSWTNINTSGGVGGSQNVNGLNAGTYLVTVTDANGCQAFRQVELSEPDPLVSTISSPTFVCGYNISCNGASDGSIDIGPTGGADCLPYNYAWTGPSGFTASTEDLVNLGPGTYTVVISDANGCSTTQSITLTQPDPLVITALSSPTFVCGYNISCNGAGDGSINLDLDGGADCVAYTYAWTGPGGFTASTEDLNNLDAGTYNITVTDANGCSVSNSITLTEPDPLVISNLSSPTFVCGYNISCNGAGDGSINLDLTGGASCVAYTYAWTGPGGFTASTEDLSGLDAGTYNVTVTDANGCSVSNSITLTEPDPLVISNLNSPTFVCGYNISCNGAGDGSIALDLTGGADCVAYTYAWTGPGGFTSSSEDLNNLDAGTYNVTVTDANGCSVSGSLTLTEPDPLMITALSSPTFVCGYNISCNGAGDGSINLDLDGGADCVAYTYAWTGPAGFTASTEDLSNLDAGTYNITVTDANGCSVSSSITLTEPDPLVISNLSSPTFACGYNISCNGASDGSINLDLTGGASCVAYTYSWSGPGGFTSTSEDLSNLVAGTYNITVTDANGCSVSNSITLTEPDPLVISNLSSPTFNCGYNLSCNGAADGSIALDLTGGASCVAYTYSWSGPGGFTSTSEDLSNLDAGTYYVDVTDANGCFVTDTIVLTEPDPLVIDSIVAIEYIGGYNIRCNGELNGTVFVYFKGGADCLPANAVATGPAATSSGNSFSPITIGNLGAGLNSITVTDANGCSATGTITLTEPDTLVTDAGPNQTVYFGFPDSSCAFLQATGTTGGVPGYSYQWVDDLGNTVAGTDTTTVCPSQTTVYYLTVTDTNGCSFTDSMQVCVVDVICPGPGNGNGNGNGGNNSSQTYIRICHVPPGNPNNAQTKCIPITAIASHLANGSFLGDCSQGPNPSCDFNLPTSSKVAEGDQASGAVPGQDLFEAFPNPFQDKTTIRFRLAEDDFVSLRVFNLEGKEVGVYFEEEVEAGKSYEVEFEPNDIVDGVYMAKLISRNGVVRYRKLILVR